MVILTKMIFQLRFKMRFITRNSFWLFLPLLLSAQDLVTDRPDHTESATTLPWRSMQVETGILYEYDQVKRGLLITENSTLALATTLIRYGITRKIELRLGGQIDFQRVTESGITNSYNGLAGLYVGTKIQLHKERRNLPGAALLIGANLPIGNKEIAPDKVEPDIILAAENTLSDQLSLGYNLGTVIINGSDVNLLYSASLGIALGRRLGAFVELYGYKEKAGDPNLLFDWGLTFLVQRNVQLDTSVGVALTEDAADWFLNAGFSFRLPR